MADESQNNSNDGKRHERNGFGHMRLQPQVIVLKINRALVIQFKLLLKLFQSKAIDFNFPLDLQS